MKYQLVVELHGKTFKSTKLYDECHKHFAEREARRLNHLRESKATVEVVGDQSS